MRPDSEPRIPVPAARGLAFLALALFGALHWMVLVDPAAPRRALYALGAGAVAMLGLLAAGALGPRLRRVAASAVALGAFGLALLAGGVADELLRPDRWGSLLSGIGRGVESLPGVRVPYRGVDQWTLTVIPLGGTVLATAAAVAAFWPRPRGTGFPAVALGLLIALYAIPAVALDFESEFLRGAALTLLVLAFLWLEKLRLDDVGTAGMVAGGVAVLALMVAPALDRDAPWWDYERWALGAASARSTAFTWDHSYGPLDWPRDGRELLRVRAERRPAYWKAANLDFFDSRSWRQTILTGDERGEPSDRVAVERGTQRIDVTVRNLSSTSYVTAGYALDVDAPTIRETPRGDGTWTAGRPLRRGDAYEALVYEPDATESQRRASGNSLADARYLRLYLPGSGDAPGQTGAPRYHVDFPRFGDSFNRVTAREDDSSDASTAAIAREVLEEGPYRRSYRLARRLMGQSRTQEDFVQAVMDYLGDGYSYTETPRREAQNLDGFLFDARAGYCQQFSGAMALLLRMGGVPARVATGFTSGSQDSKTKEYVVRDLDAHSWVEVWYDTIGWETFDPTPAAAPARSQPNEGGGIGAPGALAGPPSLGGDRPGDIGRRGLAQEPGPQWGWIALAAAGGLALAGWAVAVVRRRRRAAGTAPAVLALDELERALRRARRHPGPGTTLNVLEARFARSPAAAGYVRSVRELRYGGRAGAPTRAQRRALRSELGRGTGLAGRLRAWWALPPRRA